MFSCGVFFLVFLSKCLSKYPSSTKPSLPRKISGYIPALRDHYFCKVIHLTCLTGFWIRLRLDNSSVICTVILCIYCTRYVQNSDIFRTLFIQACAIMFRYVQHYYGLFRDIEALLSIFRFIQLDSASCVTLANSPPSHMTYLKLKAYSKPSAELTSYIQNPPIVYSYGLSYS